MILKLSDSEAAILRDYISPKGRVYPVSEHDWQKIGPGRRKAIARALKEIDEMADTDQAKNYVNDLFGEGVEIDERQENESLEDATSRLIEQAPGRWAEMSEKDRGYILNLVDRLETEGLRLRDEAAIRTPEIKKLIDLSDEEWRGISKENETLILIKLQELADHTDEGEGNHKVRFVSLEDARQLCDRLRAGDQEAYAIVIKYCMGEVEGLTVS